MTQATDQIREKIKEIDANIDKLIADKHALEQALTILMQDFDNEATRIQTEVQHEVYPGTPIPQMAIEVLKKAGKPLHLKELRTLIRQRGSPSTPNTIATGIYRAAKKGKLTAIGGGMFGIPEWNGNKDPNRIKLRKVAPVAVNDSDVLVSE